MTSRRTTRGNTTPGDRRQRIVTAALDEFVERGYDGASTNAIAKRARVSKGLLFHNFGSKQGLYMALWDEAVSPLSAVYGDDESPAPSDPMERLVYWSERKLHFFRSNPNLYRFIMSAVSNPPARLREQIARKRKQLEAEGWRRFLIDLDTTGLRSDISVEEALEIVRNFVEALEAKYIAQLASSPDDGPRRVEEMVGELRRHLLVLRDGLYRRADVGPK